MAQADLGPIALFSIKPRYAEAIMSGRKVVEFRKVRCQRNVRIVVVYASSPVRKVLGYFRVAFVDEASPRAIWRRYGRTGGIGLADYNRYYAGAKTAVVIGVGRIETLTTARKLSALPGCRRPPQSFQYLSAGDLSALGGPT